VLEVAVFENVGKNFYRALTTGLESELTLVVTLTVSDLSLITLISTLQKGKVKLAAGWFLSQVIATADALKDLLGKTKEAPNVVPALWTNHNNSCCSLTLDQVYHHSDSLLHSDLNIRAFPN
jgi:hypothetical protein